MMTKELSKEPMLNHGPLGPNERRSVRRKGKLLLRLLRGEPLDTLSRELNIEIYHLDQWREKALEGWTKRLGTGRGNEIPGTAAR